MKRISLITLSTVLAFGLGLKILPGWALENKGGAYFYSFYDQEIGRLATEAGGIGLARMIHEYTEKNTPSLKFSEPIADTVVAKDHIPTLTRVAE